MKKRIYAVAAVASALGLILLVALLRNRSRSEVTQQSTQPSGNESNLHSTFQDVSNAVANPSEFVPDGIKSAVREHKGQQDLTRAIEGQNQPVDFYGSVIDQNGASLPGAKVRGSVRHWDASVANFGGSLPLSGVSDSAGLFHLAGVTGDAVSIDTVEKAGYELEPMPRGYGAAEGSPEKPIIFRMWDTNIHEQLITGSKSFNIIPDGRDYFINLTNGTISESGEGDLKVWVKRPDSVGKRDRYEWSCGAEVSKGGLVEDHSPGGAMFHAPTEGYTSTFLFEQKVGSGWGDMTGPKRFYLSLNGGKIYGQMTIELFAYYNKQIPGMVRLNYAINPSGSQILK